MVAALLAFALSQAPTTQPTAPADSLRKIQADLKEARGLLKNVTDRATREKLELLLARSELAAAELAKASPVKLTAMPDADFAKVLASLKSNSFDDAKLTFVKSLGSKPRFSSEQAKQLLAAFSFDTDRVPAAVSLYAAAVDPENYFRAVEAFTFKSSKDQVWEKLGVKK